MAELTPKQRKTFAKITEALQEFPFGATIQNLYNEARLSMTVIKNALEKMDSVEQRGDSWFLKTTDGSRAGEAVEPTVEQLVMQDSAENLQDNTENTQEDIGNTQDAPVNMQDKGLNTQAPHVSYHDNESSYPDNGEGALINPSAEIDNPSAGVVNPSDIDTDTDPDAIINEGVKQISILKEAKDAPYEKLIMPKKPRNKPFTPNPIMGYQVQKGKAKIFLDRRATSKTLTLSLDDLKELVNAVEKSERVA